MVVPLATDVLQDVLVLVLVVVRVDVQQAV